MKIKRNKGIIKITFWVYIFILISVLVFKFPTGMVKNALLGLLEGKELYRSPMQLVPFKTIIEYAKNVHSLTDWFIKNLACNIIMFLPMGFFVPSMIEDKGIKVDGKRISAFAVTTMSGFLFSVVIELVQYITCLGLCDIDDVILNTVGGILGYFVYCMLIKIKAVRWCE